MDLCEIGQKIRDRRKRLGISQQELAETVGYTSKVAISRIEMGQMKVPIDKMITICGALQLNMAEFLDTYQPDQVVDKDKLMILDNITSLSAENQQKLIEYIRILKESELWQRRNGTDNDGGSASR